MQEKKGKNTFLRNEAAAHICTLLLSELKEKIVQTRHHCSPLKLCYLSQSFENLVTINLPALDIYGWSSVREISFYMKGIIQKTSEKYIFWGGGEDQLWTCFASWLLPREWALTVQHFWIINKKPNKGRLEKVLNLENFLSPQLFFLTTAPYLPSLIKEPHKFKPVVVKYVSILLSFCKA